MGNSKNTLPEDNKSDQKDRSNSSLTPTESSMKTKGETKIGRTKNEPTGSLNLPNSLRLKAPNSVSSRQNMSSILQRLPFLKQLSSSKNSVQKLKPTWLFWCKQWYKTNSSLALKLDQHASPTSLKHGTLNIACNNTAAASLLKHQQSSLLKAFHNANFDEITNIKVQMLLTQTSPKKTPKSSSSESVSKRSAPSASAVKSIEATQSLIDNEQLAASLKRLAQTLKSSSTD